MAGTIAGRHPHRTRAFRILFSHRHLHHSQHRVELALVDFPALTIFQWSSDHAFKLDSMTMSLVFCDAGVARAWNRRPSQAAQW
jgi:hypothetical protein